MRMKKVQTFYYPLNLKDKFEKQQVLTNFLRTRHGINRVDPDKEKGAIICELWETCNELKSEGFKVWTTKKRTDEVLEEVVDILHFYLQIGNDLQVTFEHDWIEVHPTIMKQFLAINTTLLAIDGPLIWALSFAQFRGLVQLLGFTWDEHITPAYDAKYIENFKRQERGY